MNSNEIRKVSNNNDIATNLQNNITNALLQTDFVKNQKQNAATYIYQTATEKIKKGWFDCCNFTHILQPYFNVENTDIKSRILHSLIPFNPRFYDIIDNNPDLYGPFWISSTLILTIAASGGLHRYLYVSCTLLFSLNQHRERTL